MEYIWRFQPNLERVKVTHYLEILILLTSYNIFLSKVSEIFLETIIMAEFFAGLEKKKQKQDHASSRTQDIRSNEAVNNMKIADDKIHNVKIQEYLDIENVENDHHNYEHDYDFDSDYSDDNDSDDTPANIDKPEYYYYYYYDYLDSGIDISHELSNNVAAQYEPLPTPLWQVSDKQINTDIEGRKDRDNEEEYAITTDSTSTLYDKDSDSSGEITGDKNDVTEKHRDDPIVI